jgi:hypothetical protein
MIANVSLPQKNRAPQMNVFLSSVLIFYVNCDATDFGGSVI